MLEEALGYCYLNGGSDSFNETSLVFGGKHDIISVDPNAAKEKSRLPGQLLRNRVRPVQEGQLEMSSYHNIKSKSGSTSSKDVGQKSQIIPFPFEALPYEVSGDCEQSEEFKAALLSVNPNLYFPSLQDVLYKALFDLSAVQLRAELGIDHSVTIRECLSPLALDSLIYAEKIICQHIEGESDLSQGLIEWKVEFVGKSLVGPSARLAAKYLRVNLVTGEAEPPEV